jgi:energy-coupling factor transporter ATP-binding protein EcfA2
MIRGGGFYAVWDQEANLWSTDEYRVAQMIDQALFLKKQEIEKKTKSKVSISTMTNFSSRSWANFKTYMTKLGDNYKDLDKKLSFRGDIITRESLVSKQLDYALEPGEHPSYDKLMGVLYNPEELHKIEWAIGSVIAGDSSNIQKFYVFYGESGSGKSTAMNIMQDLFAGYYTAFDAKALVGNSAFAFESLRANPLVGIQHDVDLSEVTDNAKLNAIVSHEEIVMNIKNRSTFSMRINATLFLGSNRAVKITDAKSGIVRRLVDIKPSGRRVPEMQYAILVKRIKLELGAIAHHCLKVYKKAGADYYSIYKPLQMMFETDTTFNFIANYADMLESEPYVLLSKMYTLYKEYCADSNIKGVMPKYKFREEMKVYFKEFHSNYKDGAKRLVDVFIGFLKHRLSPTIEYNDLECGDFEDFLELNQAPSKSILKTVCRECRAAYAEGDGVVHIDVTKSEMILDEIDEKKTHFVVLPPDHITIDIDLKDENGQKDLARAKDAAKEFPPTYAEVSNSGQALHLHYIYTGDIKKLKANFGPGIEIKKSTGHSALRRRLSLCNNHPITKLTGPLPTKERKLAEAKAIQTEKGLRDLIDRNLKKEIHAGTYPSVMFILTILDEAFKNGLRYDVSDMQQTILNFAMNSTNHAKEGMRCVSKMKWKSAHTEVEHAQTALAVDDRPMVYFDMEVYRNFNCVVYQTETSDEAVSIANPTKEDAEWLLTQKLVGFNNKGYDNHILYGISLGHKPEKIYQISDDIINNGKRWYYREAVGMSYLDIYEMLSDKKGLKKLQIEHGLNHMELDKPWNEDVKPNEIPGILKYCKNDVVTLKQIHKIYDADYKARQMLAAMSGLPLNASTMEHDARIIFGTDSNPKSQFVYTHLNEMFPGYEFDGKVSHYRGHEAGEGGFVYAEPGMYMGKIRVLDVESMHPRSIIQLNAFGDEYTQRFARLVNIRLAIKHKDYELAKELLAEQANLLTPDNAKDMAFALKIHAINSVYGLTMAKGGPFRDPRNVDNIIAKRGALFMIDLLIALQERGARVLHVKTDSVKLMDPTEEDVAFVHEFGQKYGYTFSEEDTYDRFCLLNKAVYIARKIDTDKWEAVGAQYAHPWVYKNLFQPGKPITYEDCGEIKSVTGGSSMYLKKNDTYIFQGRTGSFMPVLAEGGELYRLKDGKYYHVAGTTGHDWFPTAMVRELDLPIDKAYYDNLLAEAVEPIRAMGNFDLFFSKEN